MVLPNFIRKWRPQTLKNITRGKQANTTASKVARKPSNVPAPNIEAKPTVQQAIKRTRSKKPTRWEKAAMRLQESKSVTTAKTNILEKRWLTDSQAKFLVSTYNNGESDKAKNRALKMLQINKDRWIITPEQYDKLSAQYWWVPTTNTWWTAPVGWNTAIWWTSPAGSSQYQAPDIPYSANISSDVSIPTWWLLDKRRQWEMDTLRWVLDEVIDKRDEFLSGRDAIRDVKEEQLRSQLDPNRIAEVWEPFDIAKSQLELQKDKQLYEMQVLQREEIAKFEELQAMQEEQNSLSNQSIIRIANTVGYRYSPQMFNQIQTTKQSWLEALNKLQEASSNFNADIQSKLWFLGRQYILDIQWLDSKKNQAIRDYQNDLTDKLLNLQLEWLNDSEQAWEKNKAEVDRFLDKQESINTRYLKEIADTRIRLEKRADRVIATQQKRIDRGTVGKEATTNELLDSVIANIPKEYKGKTTNEQINSIVDWVKDWTYYNVEDWINKVLYGNDWVDYTQDKYTIEAIENDVMIAIWDLWVTERWKLSTQDITNIVNWLKNGQYPNIQFWINSILLKQWEIEDDKETLRVISRKEAQELAKKSKWNIITTAQAFSWIYGEDLLSESDFDFLNNIPSEMDDMQVFIVASLYAWDSIEHIIDSVNSYNPTPLDTSTLSTNTPMVAPEILWPITASDIYSPIDTLDNISIIDSLWPKSTKPKTIKEYYDIIQSIYEGKYDPDSDANTGEREAFDKKELDNTTSTIDSNLESDY